MRKVLDHATEIKARQIQFRVVLDPDHEELIAMLPALGFRKCNTRLEFQKPVHELPGENGSPMTWEAMAPLGTLPEEEIARLLHAVAEGDPTYDPKEDVTDFIREVLSDTALTSGPDCIHVGRFQGEVAALVMAQVDPKTGWSRISYMGVLPSHRKKGLGAWAQRHGFAMMLSQGGRSYHGGTVDTNTGMLQLFRKHDCTEHRKMEEWACDLPIEKAG